MKNIIFIGSEHCNTKNISSRMGIERAAPAVAKTPRKKINHQPPVSFDHIIHRSFLVSPSPLFQASRPPVHQWLAIAISQKDKILAEKQKPSLRKARLSRLPSPGAAELVRFFRAVEGKVAVLLAERTPLLLVLVRVRLGLGGSILVFLSEAERFGHGGRLVLAVVARVYV